MPKMQPKGTYIEKEIFRSGTTTDGRYIDRRLVKEIFKNTKKNLIEKEVPIPVKPGHKTDTEVMSGYVEDIYLKGWGNGTSLYAKIFLFEDSYELFATGRLPGLSVELAPAGYHANGTKYGVHMYALAMLGNSPAAFPLLHNAFKDNAFHFSFKPLKAKKKGALRFQLNEFYQKVNTMKKNKSKKIHFEAYDEQEDIELLEELQEWLSDGKELIDELLEDEEGEGDEDGDGEEADTGEETDYAKDGMKDKDDDDDDDDDDDEKDKGKMSRRDQRTFDRLKKKYGKIQITPVKEFGRRTGKGKQTYQARKADRWRQKQDARLTSREANLLFNELVANGKAVQQDKNKFMQLVDKTSIEFATKYYEDAKVETPPKELVDQKTGKKVTAPSKNHYQAQKYATKAGTETSAEELLDLLYKSGLTDGEIEMYMRQNGVEDRKSLLMKRINEPSMNGHGGKK